MSEPHNVLPFGFQWLSPMLARLARRWIASGIGCDTTSRIAD